MKVFAIISAVLLVGCADSHPQGAVKSAEQAISIAQKACDWRDVPGDFHAKLERASQGVTWFVWKGTDYRLQITIDADTGRSPDGCTLPG